MVSTATVGGTKLLEMQALQIDVVHSFELDLAWTGKATVDGNLN